MSGEGDMGMKDWSWDQCLPAFKRLESDMDYKNEWHGNDGPLPLGVTQSMNLPHGSRHF